MAETTFRQRLLNQLEGMVQCYAVDGGLECYRDFIFKDSFLNKLNDTSLCYHVRLYKWLLDLYQGAVPKGFKAELITSAAKDIADLRNKGDVDMDRLDGLWVSSLLTFAVTNPEGHKVHMDIRALAGLDKPH